MFGTIVITILALAGSAFMLMRSETVYSFIQENTYNYKGWLAKIGVLLIALFNTGAAIRLTENLQFLQYVIPILVFAVSAYFLIIRPTSK